MKKFLIFLCILCVGLGGFFAVRKLTEQPPLATYMMAAPGRDASKSVVIGYHAPEAGTRIEYTEAADLDFAQAKTIVPREELTGFKTFSGGAWAKAKGGTGGWPARYVCRAELAGLQPETAYRYRVAGSRKTESFFFKTGAETSAAFSFLHVTDAQFSGRADAKLWGHIAGFAQDFSADFMLSTGDLAERGGQERQWEILHSFDAFRFHLNAHAPGNHEYYDGSFYPRTVDNRFFEIMTPYPVPEVRCASSYYFLYNQVLFIMLDSEAKAGAEMAEWLRGVLQAHRDAPFKVVGMHRTLYGSHYRKDSAALVARWGTIFDEFAVDLVLSGHDHIYARTYPLKGGVQAAEGTVYVTGGPCGDKFYTLHRRPEYAYALSKTSTATLYRFTAEGMSGETFDRFATRIDRFFIPKKK